MAPHKPGKLCKASESLLLYINDSTHCGVVHWLDLSGLKPKPAEGKRVINVSQSCVFDMCCVQDGEKQLLVVVSDFNEIVAYNTETDEVEWELDQVPFEILDNFMQLTRITTDGRGHLLVNDNHRRCIHMFSVSDGKYIGCLMKDIDLQDDILWFEKASPMLVCSQSDFGHRLKVINFEY